MNKAATKTLLSSTNSQLHPAALALLILSLSLCAPKAIALTSCEGKSLIAAEQITVVDGDTVHVRLNTTLRKALENSQAPENESKRSLRQRQAAIKTTAKKSVVKVRVLGINTPELQPFSTQLPEPLARQAKHLLQQTLGNKQQVLLQLDEKLFDHHGRLLAHLYTQQKTNASAILLREGLAFHTPMAPNNDLIECYAKAEQSARRKRLGIWSMDYYRPQWAAAPKREGFTLLRGRVTKVSASRNDLWIELNDKVALQIDKKLIPNQPVNSLKRQLLKQDIVSRGWMVKRRLDKHQNDKGYKAWHIKIGHWHNIQTQDSVTQKH